MKRPTQVDVARAAGVSRATVSYVVNGLANGRVSLSPETYERVLAAARELGYQPDARAQSLRSGGAGNTIGLLLPDLHNPYYWKIAASVEREAHSAGFDLALFTTSLDATREEQTIRALARRRMDGLIVSLSFPGRMHDALRGLARRHSPVVTLSSHFPGIDAVLVSPGYHERGKQLIGHLVELGHRRIGLIYGLVNPEIDGGRRRAYDEALAEFGLPLDERLIDYCGATIADGYAATNRLLRQNPAPTALVALNDLLAMGALRALHERGLPPPIKFSIVGFDNIDFAAYLNPPLTTVHYAADMVGRAAVQLILQRLQEPSRAAQTVYLPTELVVRGSTGKVPTEF